MSRWTSWMKLSLGVLANSDLRLSPFDQGSWPNCLNFRRPAPHLTSFCHQRDVKHIHIVRRFAPVETTTATPAVPASCVASHFAYTASGKAQTCRVRCPGLHVCRPSTPRASPCPCVGCFIFVRGSPRALLYVSHVGLHVHSASLCTPCASLRFPRKPTQYLCVGQHSLFSMLAWSQTRCAQPECEGEETASTPGMRWCTRRGENMRPLLERTLRTAGIHHRRKTNSESHSHLSPSIVHDAVR